MLPATTALLILERAEVLAAAINGAMTAIRTNFLTAAVPARH